MECCGCEREAEWIRHTQFAGSHPFCDQHARLEKNFPDSNSYIWWENLTEISDNK